MSTEKSFSTRGTLSTLHEQDENLIPGLPEKLITCPVCKKTLKTPKCLPCLHSVCMKCLHAHIMASGRLGKTFPCPVCGESTPAPAVDLKAEEWAKHFTSNPLVDTVIDAIELRKGDRKCDPCRTNRKRALAITWCSSCREALCSTCTGSHRGMRLTRGHALIDLSTIASQPVAAIIQDEKCPDHGDQFLVFYCRDHRQQCCPTCAIAVHRRCENVLEMSKLGKDIRTQGKADKLLKRLHACIEEQQTALLNKGDARDALVSKKIDTLKEIRDLKIKIVELLDDMETAFIKEFDLLHQEHEHELKASIDAGNRITGTMENTASMLQAAITHASDSQLFTTFEKIQDECRRYEKYTLENRKECKELVYTFKMDERLRSVATTVRKFGHLSIQNDEGSSKPLRECSVRETSIFGARTPFDDLRGVDAFHNGDVIISDRMSKSVLLFRNSGEFVSHVNFNARPWGVAVLGVRTACVSLPESREIHILKSSYTSLEDFRTISTGISCFALTNFVGEYLAIQHREEKEEKGRVQIAQSDKQLTHKVAIDITANHDNIQGITYDEATSKIYISTDFDAVECYNARGRLVFRNAYKGYGDFRGMAVDKESTVYVASHAGKGILQLSGEGERIRMIPTSPLAPLDIAIVPRANKMVVVGRSDIVYIYTFR
ncbi:uncharacterized protein LOC128214476 [Mya arenaria]|uniref:uncharacterized protein LOC128214476 n=1 Tax=Mya arenaria TaxID=6604 RepID=UPI0022E5D3F3|nr:uncharacterized protein LOC128214476 [Mya arenaria]